MSIDHQPGPPKPLIGCHLKLFRLLHIPLKDFNESLLDQRYTTLQFGPNESRGSVELQLEHTDLPPVEVFYVTLHHRDTNSRTKIFCSADRHRHVLPVSFSHDGLEYDIQVQGLVKITTEYGSFYEVIKSCTTVIKIQPASHGPVVIPLVLGDNPGNDQDGESLSQVPLNIGITHHQSPRGVHYSVHTYETFPTPKTFFVTLRYNGSLYLATHTGTDLNYNIPLYLKPAQHLSINVFVGEMVQEIGGVHRIYGIVKHSGTLEFRTYTTKDELQVLLQKALSYRESRSKKLKKMVHISHLYRNKPEQYWREIEQCHQGVMKPYRKDFNGDPHSVINGNMDGLFFSAVLDHATKQPPNFSFYGPQRFHVATQVLFQPHFRLYFADFYCHYTVHYVTLVLTPPGFPYDLFCQNRLPLLNNLDNPILQIKYDAEGKPNVYVTMSVHVEILFTESINIYEILKSGMGHFSIVQTHGRGHSKPEGIPKNSGCKICNF